MLIMYKTIEISFENLETIIVPKERVINLNYGEGGSIYLDILIKDSRELRWDMDDEHLSNSYYDTIDRSVSTRPNVLGRILNESDITSISEHGENHE